MFLLDENRDYGWLKNSVYTKLVDRYYLDEDWDYLKESFDKGLNGFDFEKIIFPFELAKLYSPEDARE